MVRLRVSVRGSVPEPDFASAITRAHARVGRLGVARGRLNADKHRKSGEMARNLRSRVLPKGVEFYDTAPQASFVEYGTRPHVIRPKNARALRWVGESGPIFATRVNHPGNRPMPWLAPAIEDHADTLIGVYGNAVERELDG